MRPGQDAESPLEIVFEDRIEEADAQELLERNRLQPLGAHDVEDIACRGAVLVVVNGPRLHADDGAGEPGRDRLVLRQELDLDLLAASLVQDLAEGGVRVEVDREAVQDLVDRVLAIVADRRDPAAAEILKDEAFEKIVDVGRGKSEVDMGIAGDLAAAFEVADAAVEEDDLLDRQGILESSLDGGDDFGTLAGTRVPADADRGQRDGETRDDDDDATHGFLRED